MTKLAAATRNLLAMLSLALPACGPHDVPIGYTADPEFNDRMRPDGQGLDPSLGQDTLNPTHGPFRNGSPTSEVVSEIFPALDGAEEKLIQSNCFWISNPANGVGDFVRVSWEVVVNLYRPALNLTCASPTRVGLCRFRDPITGDSIEVHDLDEDSPPCPDDGEPLDSDLVLGAWAFEYSSPGGTFRFDDVTLETDPLPIQVMDLNQVAVAGADPYRACPGDVSSFTPFDGAETDVTFFDGTSRCTPSAETNLFLACSRLCTARPLGGPAPEGATYRLVSTSGILESHLSPSLMSVDDTATLTRPMAWTSGSYLWQTGNVATDGGRWHENFSPSVRVESVRVFVLENGVESELPLLPGTALQIAGSMPSEALEVIVCAGEPSGDGTTFPLFSSEASCEGGGQTGELLEATPTYLHRHLEASNLPLTLPLSWTVVPQTPVTGDVFIEFTVRGQRKEGMALRISSPHEFGNVPVGEKRRQTVRVENIGGEVAIIDSLTVQGPDASDFSYLLPTAARGLPLGVTGRAALGGVTLSARTGALADPPLLASRVDASGRSLSSSAIRYEGSTETFNGHSVTFQDGLALYEDPDASFFQESVAVDEFSFELPAFVARSPPFELWPGETMEAVVTAQPGGYGSRYAELRVDAHQLTDPAETLSPTTALLIDGVAAPYLGVEPRALFFPAGSEGNRSWTRALLVTNPTLFDVDRSFQITGPDAALFDLVGSHPASLTLAAGDAEVFRVRYLLPCPGPLPPAPHRADLEIATAHGIEVVELTGNPPAECIE